jgi:uncharacterized protein
MRNVVRLRICFISIALLIASAAGAAEETGIAAHRPIIAGACRACVWGPLAEVVRDAMKPAGYDVQVCYNCNQTDSPRYVAYAWKPKPPTAHNLELGDPPPPNGPVDFGVTESNFLSWIYEGKYLYAKDGPQRQLRLLAMIEDPVYILVAVKKDSGITDLSQLAARKQPLRILTEDDPWVAPILQRYHLTRKEVESRGGKFVNAMGLKKDPSFDVIISSLGSLAANLESNVWYEMSQKFDLRYLDVPRDVLTEIVNTLGGELTEVPYGYLRGVDRRIPTAGRSGQAVYGRADMPDDFAYAVAKALDEQQGLLKWSIRPFSYNVHTVWKNGPVQLHPGAERYYRERGYIEMSPTNK